jgi:hypothetical protein
MAIHRRAPLTEVAVLDSAVTAVLLAGWSARPPEGDDPATTALFELFLERDAGAARLWREHSEFLRMEAKRLKIAPEFGPRSRLFFAEDLARVKRGT